MNGTAEYYAKWNKPGGERQIPYDLTYWWNLIKQAKQNQRQGNKEQIDSVQREGGGDGGKKEKGQDNGEGIESERWVGQGRVMGWEMGTTVIEQQ